MEISRSGHLSSLEEVVEGERSNKPFTELLEVAGEIPASFSLEDAIIDKNQNINWKNIAAEFTFANASHEMTKTNVNFNIFCQCQQVMSADKNFSDGVR